MPVVSKSRLAANDLSDWMKRQSPACSTKRSIAHGPASDITCGCVSSPSSQKHSAERKAKRSEVRKWNTTGSAGRCVSAQASTVLVVPKSSPSERCAETATRISAHRLDARELVLLAQLLLDLHHRLAQALARKETLLELVVVDVFLPRRGLAQLREHPLPIGDRVGGHLRRGPHPPKPRRRGL